MFIIFHNISPTYWPGKQLCHFSPQPECHWMVIKRYNIPVAMNQMELHAHFQLLPVYRKQIIKPLINLKLYKFQADLFQTSFKRLNKEKHYQCYWK